MPPEEQQSLLAHEMSTHPFSATFKQWGKDNAQLLQLRHDHTKYDKQHDRYGTMATTSSHDAYRSSSTTAATAAATALWAQAKHAFGASWIIITGSGDSSVILEAMTSQYALQCSTVFSTGPSSVSPKSRPQQHEPPCPLKHPCSLSHVAHPPHRRNA